MKILLLILLLLLPLIHGEPYDSELISRDSSVFPLDLRSIDDYKLTDYLLVSDMDGNLHLLDRNTGNVLWSLPFDEPLIELKTNKSHLTDNSNILWLVEPYNDGLLYYFTPEFGLNKLPASIKELVLQSPFYLPGDDKIYTGTRKTSLHVIDIHTGEIVDQFGNCDDKCSKSFRQSKDHIMIGKTTYELTIHSQLNSDIVWYVTYSQWGPNNIDNDLILQNQKSLDELYFTPFHDKSLLAINQELGTPVWISKLPLLSVNVFDVFLNSKINNNYVMLPHPLKVLNDLQINQNDGTINNDLCFVNRTADSNQWFAMSFVNYPTLIKSAPISKYQMLLFKSETNLDVEDLVDLRNLDLESDCDDVISGIHKYHHLNAATHYLPQSNFKHIVDDPHTNKDVILRKTSTNLPIPNIIEGIRFQSTATEDHYLVEKDNSNTLQPYEAFEPEIQAEVQPLSWSRRIFEDLTVLVVFLALVLSLTRNGFFVRKVKNFLDKRNIRIVVNIDEKEKAETEENPGRSDQSLGSGNAQVDLEHTKIDSEKVQELLENDAENTQTTQTTQTTLGEKKKRKRGARGGRRGKKKAETEDSSDDEASTYINMDNNLTITDRVLGYGSHGTVVFQGTFENRPVAVKRMLKDFFDVANHEVSLLQQSDDHPNVIRYFCSQSSTQEKFLYIALELCQGSLDNLIEKSQNIKVLESMNLDYPDLLLQLTTGLDYLHNLKIVHRDLKPQNILIGDIKHKVTPPDIYKIRLLISDFGLCKKLDHDQSSFNATNQTLASGTAGWRAPELLLNHDISEISPETVNSNKRLTKAIDIFSLGCIFFYIMTGGNHPFGDRYMREANIVKGVYNLSLLDNCQDKHELKHLIGRMIHHNPMKRPSTSEILKHPFFWSKSKKLEFLLKSSDRFDIEKRDPPSPLLLQIEKSSKKVTGGNWHLKFDDDFMNNLGKYRKYQPDRVCDLLRALRNKYHHFNDMPSNLQEQMSPLPNGFYDYFNEKFPNLLMETYFIVERNLKQEHIFQEYY